jgi:hypothetical protein
MDSLKYWLAVANRRNSSALKSRVFTAMNKLRAKGAKP